MRLLSQGLWRAVALGVFVLSIAGEASAQLCVDVNVRFAGRDPSPATIRSMQDEAATIWQHYDVLIQWSPDLRDVRCPVVRGSFEVLLEDQPNGHTDTVLGRTRLVPGRIDRAAIYVDYDETNSLIALVASSDLITLAGHPDIGPVDVGRALGRVLAHEIGHVLLNASVHQPFGLMRRAFAPADLVRSTRWAYSLSKKEVERLGLRERELREYETPAAPVREGPAGQPVEFPRDRTTAVRVACCCCAAVVCGGSTGLRSHWQDDTRRTFRFRPDLR